MNFLKRLLRPDSPQLLADAIAMQTDKARLSPGLCNELVALQAAHPGAVFSDKFRYGLKQLGSLYVLDWILKNKPRRVLEMGAGLTIYFDKAVGELCDYWMVDDSGFYEPQSFASAQENRKNTTFVSGLVGQDLDGLPENEFDLIFSVSVLEHAPNDTIQPICDHMRRLLRPGGRIVHSLDLPVRFAPARAERWYNALCNSGFDVPDPKPFTSAEALMKVSALMEPTHIVHEYYGRSKNSDVVIQHEWHNVTFIIDAGEK